MTAHGPDTASAAAVGRPSTPGARPAAGSPAARTAPWVGAEPPGGQVVAGAALVLALVAALEVAVRDHLGILTGLALVLVSMGASLLVRADELFTAGVLPPLLALGLLVGVALVEPEAVSVRALDPDAGAAQVVIAGFVDVAGALVVAHVLALVLVGLRVRTALLRAGRR